MFQNKAIKRNFTYWSCCASETGYLYQFELRMGEKESTEENLGPGAILKMTEFLENSHCMFFNDFLNSRLIIVKLYDKGLYSIGTAQKVRKEMPEMLVERKMKRGNFECFYFDNVAYFKWLDRRLVTMFFVILKEWQQLLLFPAGKKYQLQKSKNLAQTLSKYATNEWLVLTLLMKDL